jgi:nitrite reductase/ring-hydroxylating ferredoxin subunit/uncharacterized membrane protein
VTSPLRHLPAAIAERFAPQLDSIADRLGPIADQVGPGPLKDLLSGTWLGHPLHPVLTDVTIGTWTSAAVLDVLGGERSADAARLLVGLGVLSAGPTALAGWSDWADTEGDDDRRAGVAHALGNTIALGAFGLSWMARRRGRRGFGIALGIVGAGIASATAYIGGHLVYARGVGVDVTAFDRMPARPNAGMAADDLPQNTPTVVDVRGVPVMLLRRGDEVFAIHDRCSHRGGPLHKGTLDGDTIECPWHGSCFDVTSGEIVRGPATAPQPRYTARIADGKVEVAR